jgi:hypothetical protein
MIMSVHGGRIGPDAERDREVRALPLSLAPALFAVAQQTPRTAANLALTGLLSLSDSLSTARFDKLRMRR